MKLHFLALLAMALAIPAGGAAAEETTRVYRQGNSTATITQSGGGSTMVRRTIHGPNSQTIVQQQGGNSLVDNLWDVWDTMVAAALAGWAQATETTRVYRQGHSTATITQ